MNKASVRIPEWSCPEIYDSVSEAWERRNQLVGFGADPETVEIKILSASGFGPVGRRLSVAEQYPDRDRALGILDDLRNWEVRPDIRDLLADAMLEFAAQEIFKCAQRWQIPGHVLDRGPVLAKRAAELRVQKFRPGARPSEASA